MTSILPPNATELEKAIDIACAKQLERIDTKRIYSQYDPWNCPAHLLPHLAWAVSVENFDSSWDEQTQRQVIADSVEVHLHKGTQGSVQQALNAVFDDAQITPHDYFSFDASVAVATNAKAITLDDIELARSLIENTRPARSYLHSFQMNLPQAQADIVVATAGVLNHQIQQNLQLNASASICAQGVAILELTFHDN